jgi:hypothetical protein
MAMILKLKTLVLAMAAVLAIGAVAASAASAQGEQGFGTAAGPVTLTGGDTAIPGKNAFTAFGQEIECSGSTYTGHKVLTVAETATKKHEILAKLFTTATITPHYKCKGPALAPVVTVVMNGCDYQIFLKLTNPPKNNEGTYAVEFSVVCPAGKEITVETFTNAAEHVNKNPSCTFHIPAQFGLQGAHLKDTNNGHLDLIGTVKGIKVKRKGNVFLCPEGEVANGELDLDITVKGHSSTGANTAISISE